MKSSATHKLIRIAAVAAPATALAAANATVRAAHRDR